MKKSLLAIPCFNCQEQVSRLIRQIWGAEIFFDRILFIDNMSGDKTAEHILSKGSQLREKANQIWLFRATDNFGLGGSFQEAVKCGRMGKFQALYWLHGDDQAHVEDLLLLKQRFENKNLSAILGARFMPGAKLINYSLTREFGNRILNRVFSLALRKEICELGSGLNVYNPAHLPDVESWPSHIAFDIRILFHLLDEELEWEFFPIRWSELDQKSNARNLRTAGLLLKELWDFKTSRLKVCKEAPRVYQKIRIR